MQEDQNTESNIQNPPPVEESDTISTPSTKEENQPIVEEKKEESVIENEKKGEEKEEKKSSREEKKAPPLSKEIEDLIKKLSSSEDKIKELIAYMHKMLSQEKSPDFKHFWEAKRVCLSLFKDPLPSAFRAHYWADYVQINEEAKRLKRLLDEESLFAVEQLELAMESLEKDIQNLDQLHSEMNPIEIPKNLLSLLKNIPIYQENQKKITLLTTLGSRIHALRDEVIKTDMRISHKNKLFKTLSSLGDKIFPKRKELIEKMSEYFQIDIADFLNRFEEEKRIKKDPYYKLKDEIRSLQQLSKTLMIQPKVLISSRKALSSIWDQISEADKKRKERIEKKNEEFIENRKAAENKLKEIEEKIKTLSPEKVQEEKKGFLDYIKTLPLKRDDVTFLKDALQKTIDPIFAKESEKREKEQKEKEQKAKEKREKISSVIENLKKVAMGKDLAKMESEREALKKDIEVISKSVDPLEKLTLDSLFAKIDDEIFYQKQEKLLENEMEKPFKEIAKQILEKRIERKKAIKESYEKYRKASKESGLDFNMALQYQQLFEEEKKRLQKAEEMVEDIEDKIFSMDEN